MTILWEKGEKTSATGVATANVTSEQPLQSDQAGGIASNQSVVISESKDKKSAAEKQEGIGKRAFFNLKPVSDEEKKQLDDAEREDRIKELFEKEKEKFANESGHNSYAEGLRESDTWQEAVSFFRKKKSEFEAEEKKVKQVKSARETHHVAEEPVSSEKWKKMDGDERMQEADGNLVWKREDVVSGSAENGTQRKESVPRNAKNEANGVESASENAENIPENAESTPENAKSVHENADNVQNEWESDEAGERIDNNGIVLKTDSSPDLAASRAVHVDLSGQRFDKIEDFLRGDKEHPCAGTHD